MKLNNKGFAISTVMYIILVLAMILILATLSVLSSRKLVLDKLKNEVSDNINVVDTSPSTSPGVILDPYIEVESPSFYFSFKDNYLYDSTRLTYKNINFNSIDIDNRCGSDFYAVLSDDGYNPGEATLSFDARNVDSTKNFGCYLYIGDSYGNPQLESVYISVESAGNYDDDDVETGTNTGGSCSYTIDESVPQYNGSVDVAGGQTVLVTGYWEYKSSDGTILKYGQAADISFTYTEGSTKTCKPVVICPDYYDLGGNNYIATVCGCNSGEGNC